MQVLVSNYFIINSISTCETLDTFFNPWSLQVCSRYKSNIECERKRCRNL